MNIANLFSYAVGSKDEGKQFQMDLFAKYCALGRLKEAEKCL